VDVERSIEFILAGLAKTEAGLAKSEDKLAKTDALLSRAIQAGIREARAERRKRRELDEKMTQLAAAHLLTEEALRGFSQSLERGTNGHN
jgi:hypothetical protein